MLIQYYRILNYSLFHLFILRNENDEKLLKLLRLLGPFHSNLTNLLKLIENYLAMPILCCLGTHFIQLVACIYIVLLCIKNNKEWTIQNIGYFLAYLCWIFVHIIQIFIINTIASITVNEGNFTAKNVHKLLDNCHNHEVTNSASSLYQIFFFNIAFSELSV